MTAARPWRWLLERLVEEDQATVASESARPPDSLPPLLVARTGWELHAGPRGIVNVAKIPEWDGQRFINLDRLRHDHDPVWIDLIDKDRPRGDSAHVPWTDYLVAAEGIEGFHHFSIDPALDGETALFMMFTALATVEGHERLTRRTWIGIAGSPTAWRDDDDPPGPPGPGAVWNGQAAPGPATLAEAAATNDDKVWSHDPRAAYVRPVGADIGIVPPGDPAVTPASGWMMPVPRWVQDETAIMPAPRWVQDETAIMNLTSGRLPLLWFHADDPMALSYILGNDGVIHPPGGFRVTCIDPSAYRGDDYDRDCTVVCTSSSARYAYNMALSKHYAWRAQWEALHTQTPPADQLQPDPDDRTDPPEEAP